MIKYALSDLIPVGTLFKSQGVKGVIIGELDKKLEAHIDKINYVFVAESGQSLPFFVENISIDGDSALFKFEEINNPESATLLSNRTIYLDSDKLKDLGIEVGENIQGIIDLALYNDEKFIGTISEIVELPGHSLIKIKEDDLISIPFVQDWIISVEEDKLVMSFDEDILSINS